MSREPDNTFTTIGLSMPRELLERIDVRVGELDLNRSQYLRKLVREDLKQAAAENTSTKEDK